MTSTNNCKTLGENAVYDLIMVCAGNGIAIIVNYLLLRNDIDCIHSGLCLIVVGMTTSNYIRLTSETEQNAHNCVIM